MLMLIFHGLYCGDWTSGLVASSNDLLPYQYLCLAQDRCDRSTSSVNGRFGCSAGPEVAVVSIIARPV